MIPGFFYIKTNFLVAKYSFFYIFKYSELLMLKYQTKKEVLLYRVLQERCRGLK